MSNAELWDLDTSGGIMEQIQMLVAPPISSDALRRSRRRRDRDNYRRPGRTVNHDCCDSCKEGGDLLCCDRCPAAFHLLCHDPPLIEEELPPGEWLCHKCKITPLLEIKEEDTESTSSKSSNKSVKYKRSAASIETDNETEHPLKTLAKAARIMNPVQFDVGKEIGRGKTLPGSSKRIYGRAVRYQPKKQAHELDNGLVPLPAKTCFSCNKSCRIAPLIQCDYCPLLFHLDCLNPPLTSLPTGRWMCPNHVEHFLDSHLLKSQSLTERLRLWDKYTGLVDSHTVKVDFLNKAHRRDPMFRYKRKLPSRLTLNVPSAIKQFYENPPYLLPDPSKPFVQPSDIAGRANASSPTPEEQEEWLSSVVAMQASIAKYLTQKQFQKLSGGSKTPDIVYSKPTASVAPVVHRDPDNSSSSSSSSPSLVSSSSSGVSSTSTIPAKSTASSSSSLIPSHSKITPMSSTVSSNPSICDNKQTSTVLLNGEEAQEPSSPTLEADSPLPNGPFEVTTRGAVSLLSNSMTVRHPGMSVSSAMNGDASFHDGQLPPNNSDESRSVVRTRSSSVDSLPSPSLTSANSMWPEGDQSSLSANSNNGSKNILVSTLNKGSASTLVSKVVPGVVPQTAKVILPTGKTSIINNGNGNSSRFVVQPSSKSTSSAIITPSPKVYTVSAAKPPVSQVKATSNNLNNIASSPTIANLNAMLQSWMEGNSDFELTKIDEKLTQILAWQRLQQLMAPRPPTPTYQVTNAQPSSASSCRKGLVDGFLSQQGSNEVRARAMLCPLSGKGEAIDMPYRTLTLGTGADMDVCLVDQGHCNFISGHHATIFYDEMTRHFELLNYSEHGTTVDNVLYSCDFSDKPATTPVASPLVSAVREIVTRGNSDSTRGKGQSKGEGKHKDEDVDDRQRMCGKASKVSKLCDCKTSGSNLIGGSSAGWEGTALLHHGSYVKLGCLQYVFSIADYAPDQLHPLKANTDGAASTTTTPSARISSMPLISSSPFLHNQQQQPQPVSLLKSHLKSSGPS